MTQAPVAQWIERLFPKQKAVGSTPTWRDFSCVVFFLRNGDWLFFFKGYYYVVLYFLKDEDFLI